MNPVLTTSPDISQQACKKLFAFASVLFSNITAEVVDPSKCVWADFSLFVRGNGSTAEYHHSAYFNPTFLDQIIEGWKSNSEVGNFRVRYPNSWRREENSPSDDLEVLLELKHSLNFVKQVEGLLMR
ncbi:MAG TPA: hypothetical protein VFH95_11555 [Candidatus Kapabacteria bacterium]|nr:hypothetical protein [Candidatus Kapabacteria bacterium]